MRPLQELIDIWENTPKGEFPKLKHDEFMRVVRYGIKEYEALLIKYQALVIKERIRDREKKRQ